MAEQNQYHEPADAVVVGAGPAGAQWAATLAEASRSVVVLEAGPPWRQADMISSQIWARRLRGSGIRVVTDGDNPYAYGFNSGWGFGGAALHHYALWPRLHEEDFRVLSLYGHGLDWPVEYKDLRPFYDSVQAEVGISGDAEREIWRPPGDPYPMPPTKIFAQARVIDKGFKALGMQTAPAPLAINSIVYNGRPACIYDGWCDAGCPINALANPLLIHLPRAEKAGADLRAYARVSRVLCRSDTRVRGVEYYDRQGQRHEQPADVVILAASAIHNPALLLNSASDAHPDGIGNDNGLVGRYFMAHSVLGIFAMFDEETEPEMGVPGGQLICHDAYRKDKRDGMLGSYQWVIAPSMKPNDLSGTAMFRPDVHGAALHRFLKRAARHAGKLVAHGEDLPDLENRIELSAERDPSGFRLPRVVYRFGQNAHSLWHHARSEGLAIMNAAGARETWTGNMGSTHMMGGTIMGDDPQTSVTDSFGRLHSMDNLYLSGSGLFPTAGGVNPTFTIHALAMRSAKQLLANWPA